MGIKKSVKKIKPVCGILARSGRLLHTLRREKKRGLEVDLFDFSKLARPRLFLPLSLHWDNDLYGIGGNLLEFSGVEEKSINASIEHGYYFGSHINGNCFLHENKNILTFGVKRESTLKKNSKDVTVVKIGPYINYSKNLLSENRHKAIREHIGKTMLVFLDHSIGKIELKHNVKNIIGELKALKVGHGIQTVMMCFYWKDIELQNHLEYQKEGFEIVCAGHKFDQLFLGRLRTFIELADLTVSNEIGTHVPYCLALSKPHVLIGQNNTNDVRAQYLKYEKISETSFESREEELAQVRDIIMNGNPEKLREDKILEEYFGFKEKKSKQELSSIIESFKRS